MTPAECEQWVQTWDGRCPTCPDQPTKERRARCPMCKDWVAYTPYHPGHKIPDMGERWNQRTSAYVATGKLVWRKPVFSPASRAWMHHLTVCREHSPEKYLETFYEKV